MKKILTLIAAAMVSSTMFAVDLTKDMFHTWTSADATATLAENQSATWCDYVIGESTGMPYGNGNVDWLQYADLSEYKALVVTATEGTPRFFLNRMTANGQAATGDAIDTNNGDHFNAYVTKEGNTFTLDIEKIVSEQGFAHLNVIKGGNWANVTVTSMVLVEAAAEPFELTLTNNGAESGSEVEKLSYQFVAACPEGYELNYEAKPVLYYGETAVEGSVMPIDATSFAVRFMKQQEYAEAGQYEVVVPENTVTVNGATNAMYKGVWTVTGSSVINIENVEVGTIVDDSWGTNDVYYTVTMSFAKPEGAKYATSKGLHLDLNGENTGVVFQIGRYGQVEIEGDVVTLVYRDAMMAATDDANYNGELRAAGSYVAETEITFLDENKAEIEGVVAKYVGSVVLPNLNPVVLGTPVFNVDAEGEEITVGWVEANGIVMTLAGAENITPDMQIKVVADLYTAIPNYGQGQEGEDNFAAPEFQVVLENSEFTGDAMFGAATVSMAEFAQYVVEAGAGAFMINVKSIEVVGINGLEASWTANEEELPVGTLFEVIELPALTNGDYVILNVAKGLYLNGANSWGTQASGTKHGQFMTVEMLEPGVYTIDSHISNGGNNHYVGDNGYVDSPAAALVVEQVEGGFTIFANDKYLTLGDNGIAEYTAEATEASVWQFISRDAVYANAANGTVDAPVDVTALVGDANFSRNNQYFSMWQGTAPAKGGANENMNAERWGGNTQEFETYQIVELPNGLYAISAQGYYRYNNTTDNTNDVAAAAHADGTEVINSFLFANDVQTPLVSIADEAAVAANGKMPFSQPEASEAFGKGLYQTETLIVNVTDGTLKLGVKKTSHPGCDWTVWDNIEVYCIGQAVALGTPAFNVDADPFNGIIALGDLEANGLKLEFPEAENITPDMQINVVASLSVMVPNFGQGEDDIDSGFAAPEFQVAIENAEFTGDAMFGAPVVYLTEFAQYISEAGAGAYIVEVKSIEVVGENGVVVSWTSSEEDVLGTAFEVTEPLVIENVLAVVGQTPANEWGDQHYTVTLTIPADELAGLNAAYAYTEGVVFTEYLEDEPWVREFTFNANAIEGVEVVDEQDVVMVCTDALVSQTTDEAYEGEIRAEGVYAASAVIVLMDSNFNELGSAEFRGELELNKDVTTGITSVSFKVNDVIYNLNGQKAAKAEGIVIKNGKAILVK